MYPEHDKLHAVVDRSQAIGEFLEWLSSEKDAVLCGPPHRHSRHDCRDEDGSLACDTREGERPLFCNNIQDLLAEFFSIDRAKLEAEKLEMLEEIRRKA